MQLVLHDNFENVDFVLNDTIIYYFKPNSKEAKIRGVLIIEVVEKYDKIYIQKNFY